MLSMLKKYKKRSKEAQALKAGLYYLDNSILQDYDSALSYISYLFDDDGIDQLHNKCIKIVWKMRQDSFVCVEDLNMKAMANRGFGNGKATLDNGYGMFLTMLDYKLRDRGGQLIKVGRFFPSSQLCSHCGFKNPLVKNLSIRHWDCPNCGTTGIDRDVNAAKNIKKEGIRLLTA